MLLTLFIFHKIRHENLFEEYLQGSNFFELFHEKFNMLLIYWPLINFPRINKFYN
jgi:hypothetical protein